MFTNSLDAESMNNAPNWVICHMNSSGCYSSGLLLAVVQPFIVSFVETESDVYKCLASYACKVITMPVRHACRQCWVFLSVSLSSQGLLILCRIVGVCYSKNPYPRRLTNTAPTMLKWQNMSALLPFPLGWALTTFSGYCHIGMAMQEKQHHCHFSKPSVRMVMTMS